MGPDVTDGRRPHRTLAPDTVGPPARQPTALRGRAAKANADKRHRVRALDGGLNVALLLDCWDDLNKDAASGGEGVTWPMDAANLQTQGEAWVARLKRQRDRAKLLRRHALPTGQRPRAALRPSGDRRPAASGGLRPHPERDRRAGVAGVS